MSRQRDDWSETLDLRDRPWQQAFHDIRHSLLHRLGVYPLGGDIPLYHASTIFPVLAQVPQVLQALPVLPVLQVLLSPVLALEVPIDCSQSTQKSQETL